jgi:hypothetical protein
MDDVTVGQDETVRSENEAGTGAFAAPLLDLNVNDGRSDPLHRADDSSRVAVEQLQVRILEQVGLLRRRVGKGLIC